MLAVEKLKQKTTKFKHGLMVAMLGASTLAFTSTASATLIDSINLLNPGDKYRVLFVTSTSRDASSTDINDYNTFVQDAADAGSVTNPLGLTWNVLGSTLDVNAQFNTSIFAYDTDSVTFFNTLGAIVAVSGMDFWSGALRTPISGTEFGDAVDLQVWTGTVEFGESFSGLELGTDIVGTGVTSYVTGWASVVHEVNFSSFSLYGVSNESVVHSQTLPPVSVPEPGSSLILLGFAGLLFSRYRKQS